jgi:hypothetical protein
MTSEWKVDVKSRPMTAILEGVFRLESPEAYDHAFAGLTAGLDAAGANGYTIDLTAVPLMNSSGIRALADLVMRARRAGFPLRFVGKASVPWQAKTIASLRPLHAQLTVELS